MPDERVASTLESPAIGTGLDALIEPCGDDLRAASPALPEEGPPLGVTFSGGGFRATFAALGVLRYLADCDLLRNLRYSSSVSGGSVANGVLATHWGEVRDAGYSAAAIDDTVIQPLAERVTAQSLKQKLLRNIWRATFSKTRTDVLAWAFDQWLFGERRLHQLDDEVRWIINAANMETGVRFGFERDVLGDYVTGLVETNDTDVTVAQAVAASAAVPGAFAPMSMKGIEFPCRSGSHVRLLDGGTYDNTGIEAIDSDRYRSVFTISLAAGGVLATGASGKLPLVRDLQRANSLLYRQSRALRTRDLVRRFQAAQSIPMNEELPKGARRGLLFALATTMNTDETRPTAEFREFTSSYPERRDYDGKDLAFVPTVFDRLEPELVNLLVYRGWWLTGAAMALYHPNLAPLPAGTAAPPV